MMKKETDYENRKKRKRKKRITIGGIIRNIVLLVAIGVFLFSAYQLFNIFYEYKKGSDEYSDLRKFIAEGTVSNEPSVSGDQNDSQMDEEVEEDDGFPRLDIDFKSLLELNSDIIGWIRVLAIDEIDYPLVRGSDNEQYLHETFMGTANAAGSIFVDYQASRDLTDDNTFIYGHNMKNLSMFGNLKSLHDKEVYEKSPYIIIYTEDKDYIYEIFSYHVANVNDDSFLSSYGTKEEFQNYLNMVKRYSEYATEVEVNSEDKIITLATCTNDTTTRFLVHAKLIKVRNNK